MKLRKIIIAAILFAAVLTATARTLPPSPLPADASADQFSAERAMGTIRVLTQAPRLVGSPAYEQARDYLLTKLTDLGLSAETQDTTLDGVKVENVVGRLDGTSSSNAILLVAHLDTVETSPGATDDASGVAAILETVRALRAGPPLANTVIVLITGPEETGGHGAQAFTTQHPWAKDVRLVINLDAGGLSGPSILAATGPESGWLIRQVAATLPHPVGSSAIEVLGSPATDYTLALRKDGFTGFDFNLSWEKRIHSPADNVDNVNLSSLQHQGEHMLAVARRFGDLSLEFPKEPRPIYFDILSLTIVHYPVSWAIPILVVVTLVMGAALFLGFRRKSLTVRGTALGALALLLSMLTVPVILVLVQLVLMANLTPKLADELTGYSILSNIIRWGSAILALAATYLWYGLFRKKARVGQSDLVMGASLFLYLAAAGTSLAAPALSYLFAWPLLFTLLAGVLPFSSADASSWSHSAASLVPAVIAIVLFIPGILIALLSIDIRMVFLVPVFVAALLGFLVAPLEILFKSQGGRS